MRLAIGFLAGVAVAGVMGCDNADLYWNPSDATAHPTEFYGYLYSDPAVLEKRLAERMEAMERRLSERIERKGAK